MTQAETGIKKHNLLTWLALNLRLKEKTVSNVPNIHVAEISPNGNCLIEAEDSFRDSSKKILFPSVSTY